MTVASPPSIRHSTIIPRIGEIPWESDALSSPAAVISKNLHIGFGGTIYRDQELPVVTRLAAFLPGWAEPDIVYHPCAEEGFVLSGEGHLGGRPRSAGWYLYRPPGILHGPAGQPPATFRVMLQRIGAAPGLVQADKHEPDSTPVTDDYLDWPVPWVESLNVAALDWTPSPAGPWSGTRHKWLVRNRVTGGGTVVIELPPHWTGTGSPVQGSLEEFVLSGELSMGRQWFESWGYAARPQGQPAGEYATVSGASLLCFWDEDEFSE
jgi:hypothetical protein